MNFETHAIGNVFTDLNKLKSLLIRSYFTLKFLINMHNLPAYRTKVCRNLYDKFNILRKALYNKVTRWDIIIVF